MADNVAITAGTGTTIAADDVGAGVLVQRVKSTWGPDGTANDTDVATGKPLPIQLRASTGQSLSDTTGILISTSQLPALSTTAQIMSAGYQLVSLPSDQVKIPTVGNTAHDGVGTSDNPHLIGGCASAAAPADVSADGDAVRTWHLRNGSPVVTLNGGMVAHDGVDANNPIKIGFKATTSLSALTLVSDADRTDSRAGVDGVIINRPHSNLEDIVTGNATNTDGTSTQCIAAQAAGIKTYLTSVVLCNTSATAITVDIKDGSTVKTSLPLPAGSGCIYNPPVPIPGTAATAWNFDGSAAATTVTCSMVGFKSKV